MTQKWCQCEHFSSSSGPEVTASPGARTPRWEGYFVPGSRLSWGSFLLVLPRLTLLPSDASETRGPCLWGPRGETVLPLRTRCKLAL